MTKVVDHIGWVEPLVGTAGKNADRSNDADAGNGNPGYTLTR